MPIDSSSTDLKALSGLTQKDRITILLSEYAALRAEIMTRTRFGFQLTAIGFAVVTWLVKDPPSDPAWYFWTALFVLPFVFFVGMNANVRDLKRAANRVKELEHEIDSRAGEHLLVWETLSGALTRGMGLMASFFSGIPSLPRKALPPLDPSFIQDRNKATPS